MPAEWVGIGFRIGDEQFVASREQVREVLGPLLADGRRDTLYGNTGEDWFHKSREDRIRDFRRSDGDRRL